MTQATLGGRTISTNYQYLSGSETLSSDLDYFLWKAVRFHDLLGLEFSNRIGFHCVFTCRLAATMHSCFMHYKYIDAEDWNTDRLDENRASCFITQVLLIGLDG